jgi:acyl phosphate:glycerol-3-phosphate acyltransferase
VSSPAALLALAYLLGSLPFAFLVVRLRTGRDLRDLGSGNAGATNAMRAAGVGAGVISLALDFGKGVAAVILARSLGATPEVVALCAGTVVLGHVYPVFLGFRGGKGVATAAGALGTLAPAAAALSALAFLVVVAWKRYVSLGSVVAAATFPIFVFLAGIAGWLPAPRPSFVATSALVPVLVIFKHRENLRRLLAGVEPRLGERGSAR